MAGAGTGGPVVMSLYEALDQFVGAGVLACAAAVGAEMPGGIPLDGSRFSRYLRDRRLGDDLGAVLDAFAHEIWLAQDQRGFPQRICETHAAGLAPLLGEVRLSASDLLPAIESARLSLEGRAGNVSGRPPARQQIAEIWIARAKAGGLLLRASLIEDVARFLLETLFHHVIEQPRLLTGLKPTLADYKALLSGDGTAQQAPVPAVVPQASTPQEPRSPQTGTSVTKLPLQGMVEEIRARHGVPDGALRRFQQILATQAMSAEQRLARLDELAGWLAATVAQLLRASNDAPELQRLKAAAAAALNAGELERAMELLREVRSVLRDGRRRTEARLAEEIDTLKRQMIEEAAAAGRLAELALARCEFEAAAELFAEAAGNLPTSERPLELEYRQRQAEALAAKAETTGDARALAAAVPAFRAALALIDKNAEPAAWARNNVGLGDMLMALGTRSAAPAELELAAAAYEEAIAVIDRAAHPVRWALVQLSRAAALMEIGNRVDRDRHWLMAASALMPALEIFESRGATDLADAARGRLRTLHGALGPGRPEAVLPARSA